MYVYVAVQIHTYAFTYVCQCVPMTVNGALINCLLWHHLVAAASFQPL